MVKKTDELIEQTILGEEDKSLQKREPPKSPGRPKGSKNRKTVIEAAIQADLVDRLGKDAAQIYEKAAQMAKEGDKTMIKLFLNRLLPELKATGDAEETKQGIGGINIIIGSTSHEKGVVINQTNDEDDNEEVSYDAEG